MFKKILITTIALTLLVGAIIYAKLGQFTAMGEAASKLVMPPETVTAMQVKQTQWEDKITKPATVTAVQGVTVSAEIGGRIKHIAFHSGSIANKGDVLIKLDTSSEDAQLASAHASAALARASLVRVRKLKKQNLSSRDALDTAEAKLKETIAQVDNIKALIAKKTIRAPFAGRLGLRQVNLGQILREGDAIVSLQTLNPIHVDFSVPQQTLPRIKPDFEVRVLADAAPKTTFTGQITAIAPDVDLVTRSVRIRATVENNDAQLRPGMFVTVHVVLPEKKQVMPVVTTAIAYASFGDSVFVIEEHKDDQSGKMVKTLRQQFVRLGETRGDFIDIIDGLKPGDSVVTSGLFKLRSDMKVTIDNTLAPKPSLNPQPSNS